MRNSANRQGTLARVGPDTPRLVIGEPDLASYESGYEGVPLEVAATCEKLWLNAQHAALEAVRQVRDTLAPYGTFRTWCAGHGLDYDRTQTTLSRAFGKRTIDKLSTARQSHKERGADGRRTEHRASDLNHQPETKRVPTPTSLPEREVAQQANQSDQSDQSDERDTQPTSQVPSLEVRRELYEWSPTELISQLLGRGPDAIERIEAENLCHQLTYEQPREAAQRLIGMLRLCLEQEGHDEQAV